MTPDPRDRIDLPRLGRRTDAEMDQEIDAHLQLRIDDLVRSGLSPDAARREAEHRFGDIRTARHQLHAAARRREVSLRHRDWTTAIIGDVKFGFRQIRRSASHSALVVVTLALGIGLTTAMFTLVERVLLNPLPFPHAEQLVSLQGHDSVGSGSGTMSDDDWLDWREGTRVFATMAAYYPPYRMTVAAGDSAIRVSIASVSDDFFGVLQPRFVVGRSFTRDEVRQRIPLAVVSERIWREYLGSDPTLNKKWGTTQVVGVVASGSEYPAGTDVWFPANPVRGAGGALRNNINWVALARLKPGVTMATATKDMDRVARDIRSRDQGGYYDFGGVVRSLQSQVVDSDAASSLGLLMKCVLVVLLLVCANLTIATLGRGGMRQQEMAIRTSLGATRGRLVMQLLVEHVLLAGAGGLLGLALAWAVVRGLVAIWGSSIPRASEVRLDVRVIAFAAGISIVVGLLAGIIPSLRSSRVSLHATMKQGGRTDVGGKPRLAGMLVVMEFALALMLLTGSGLLIRSFQALLGRDLGFDRKLATVGLVLSSRDSVQRLATWDRLMAAYRAIPGVQDVGVANQIPLGTGYSGFIDMQGRENTNAGAAYRMVSEDYFRVLGVKLLSGRGFGPEDGPATPRTVVINQTMAKMYWPGENPIGKQVRARSMEQGKEPAPWLTVVGVVSDVRQFGPESPFKPEMYVFFRQAPQWRTVSMSLVVRSTLPPSRLLPMLRTRMRQVDPHLAGEIGTLDGALSTILAGRQLTMSLLTGFAALSLVLAVLGIYAVLSYTVVQRTREIAMRSALGAQRKDLLLMMLRNGLKTVAVGMAIGLTASLVLSRLMQAMLVDLSALDPVAFAAALLLVGTAAVAATMIPAVRATRLDPMLLLKGE